jgi:hypothetical protein
MLYRIISYLLVLIAGLLGFVSLFALLVALANPALLLSVFIVVAVVLYSFTSFQFWQKGIQQGQVFRPGFKDFIKVNGYVSLVFVVQIVLSFITVQANPQLLQEQLNQVAALQGGNATLPVAVMMQMMRIVIWVLLIYSLMLGYHIFTTFRLLRHHAHLFVKQTDNPS